MNNNAISLYKDVYQTSGGDKIGILNYFEYIKFGHWEEQILNYRNKRIKIEKNPDLSDDEKKELIKKEKAKIPAVTVSGTFEDTRHNNKITSHSGVLCIDLDTKENGSLINHRDELYADSYVLAGHISASGNGGIALYFLIESKKHAEAYLAIEKYLADNYKLICDPSCKNVARLRFVSYDPELYQNLDAKKWTSYLPKGHTPPPNYKPVFTNEDIDYIINQIKDTHLDLTASYDDWIKIAFSLANEFGEQGRGYFHAVSQFHAEYNPESCDKKYNSALKSHRNISTIATFFWITKRNGLRIKTPKTEKIYNAALARKKSIGKSGGAKDINEAKINTIEYLNKIENISKEEATEIIDKVMAGGNSKDEEESSNDLILIIEYIRGLNMRYNEVTRHLEDENGDMTDRKENSIFLNIKEIFNNAKISKDIVLNIMNSDRIESYNPFLEFIQKHKDKKKPTGYIEEVLDCIIVSATDIEYAKFARLMVEKWLLSIMGSIHGTYSLMILVLIGKQSTNKTNFFRNLLPEELARYYAESSLDKGLDDEFLMTEKLIIVDDEFSGKSKKEATKLKALSSKSDITGRKAYGRNSETHQRYAVLGGTCNEMDVINDLTGNRRILPVHVVDIDMEKYIKIDKTKLFMELYWRWVEIKNGWMLNKEEVKQLQGFSESFTAITIEEEMIWKCWALPEGNREGEFYTASEMLNYCESFLNKQRLYHKLFGQVLAKLGFKKKQQRGKGYGYMAIKKNVDSSDRQSAFENDDDKMPF